MSPNPSFITIPTQKVIWTIKATNNGPDPASPPVPITVTLTWSDPIIYHRISSVTDLIPGDNFGDGSAAGTSFNQSTHVWNAGFLNPGQSRYLYIETSFAGGTDLNTVLPFTLTKVIAIAGVTDIELSNNTWVDTLTSEPECDDCPPVASPSALPCKPCSVANNGGLCTSGVTKFELVPLSFVNTIEAGLNWDEDTGRYSPYLLNPTIIGSFQYNIVCYKNGLPISTWGPTTVDILPFFAGNNYTLELSPDGEDLLFKNGGVTVNTIPVCSFTDTCSELLIGDLTP